MQITQHSWTKEDGWVSESAPSPKANLVLVFADTEYFRASQCYETLRTIFPIAHIVGCSSSGNILGTEISDATIVATAVTLDKASVRLLTETVEPGQDLSALTANMMSRLDSPDLRHVFVLSDGLSVNGSNLAGGLNSIDVPVTGGLAGDGARFASTWVMADAPARQNLVAIVGFFGPLEIKSGCVAGWREFGAERYVTRSVGNVVYEIDHKPALEIYTKYLGEMAKELPSSGLRFPLSVRPTELDKPVIRTLLGTDEAEQSLTFAGDVNQGSLCRLMKTDLDSLVAAAGTAANEAKTGAHTNPELCIVVSCVGRRLVLGQMAEEELDIIRDEFGPSTVIAGFYSYGELAPFNDVVKCQLHNQTMTVTTFSE